MYRISILCLLLACGSSPSLERPPDNQKITLNTGWYTADYQVLENSCGLTPKNPTFPVFYCQAEKIAEKACPRNLTLDEDEYLIHIFGFDIASSQSNYFLYTEDWGDYYVVGQVILYPISTTAFNYELEIVVKTGLNSCTDYFTGRGEAFE